MALVDLVEGLDLALRKEVVDGDEVLDAIDGEERVAVRARHVRVDLGDHEIGGVDGGADDVDGDAEADEAVAIRLAHLDERDVDAARGASG
jgi:hypothetical protein